MKFLLKVWRYLFSTALGAWIFAAVVVVLVSGISAVYLSFYGTADGNFIKDLQPLAVIVIGLVSIYIAFNNYWEKIGHKIICKFSYNSRSKKHSSHMPYIRNLILHNKKNKVEVIDKILLYSKNLGYVTLKDFGKTPYVLKNYETVFINCGPVSAWIGGIGETDITERISVDLDDDQESVITDIKEGTHPIFYVTNNYSNTKTKILNPRIKIPKMIAMTPNGLFPIQFDWAKYDFKTILPIKNTETSSKEEEMMVYDARLIQVSELIFDKSKKQDKSENRTIKILIHNHSEKYSFINPLEKEVIRGFYGFSSPETESFEKQWEDYHNGEKEKNKNIVVTQFQKEGKNIKNYKEEILCETQVRLDSFFYNNVSIFLDKKDLSKITSTIMSRIIFLQEVNNFAQYPIIKKRHYIFATAFYPTESMHPCFEEMEESVFYRIRHWFNETLSPFTAKGKDRKAQQSEKTNKPA